MPGVPAGLPSDLLERRPDIRQAEQNLIAANARIGAARALYYPTISLTGLLGVASAALGNLFSGPARMWSYAGSLSGPIFTGGGIEGTVAQAEAQQKQLLATYERTIQNAFREVDDALVDQLKSRERLAAQGRQVAALRDYARLSRARYEGGYTSYLEVLDAERSLFNAELGYAQTQADLFNALVNVYKAMGGGWVDEADKLAPVINLTNLRDVRLELAHVYRKMDAGKLDGAEGTKRAYVLRQIHDVIVSAELERRIQELEERQGSGAGGMPALSQHRGLN